MRQDSRKIFGIGLHRTGTTSLRRAFNVLGIRCLENDGCWFMTKLDASGGLEFCPTEEIDRYRGFADNPVPLFYAELDAMYPDSRFILTLRDVDEWADSVSGIFSAWWDGWQQLPEWPLIDACHRAWYGSDYSDRQRRIETYHRHTEQVLAHFANRPGALLQLDMTTDDTWDRLCDFLAVEKPETPYPRLNTRKDL